MDKLEKKLPVILVAEDTDSNYLLVSTILKKEYELHWAKDGAEVVRMSSVVLPDIILMDICMPHVDGLEATRQIRCFNQSVPIVAVTAFAFDSDRQRALDAGCNDYLTKPISTQELKEMVKKWI